MGLLQKIRDRLAKRNSVSEDDAKRDPREVAKDETGSGGLYSPIAPPGYVKDE